MQPSLVHFVGPWMEEDRAVIEQAVAMAESRVPTARAFAQEPWTCFYDRRKQEDGYVARRRGQRRTLKAPTAAELAHRICNGSL